MMNETAVYKHTAAYALEHGELEQYRASLQANIACKNAIEAAIRQHFDGMHLHGGGVRLRQRTYLLCGGQHPPAKKLGRTIFPLQQRVGSAV